MAVVIITLKIMPESPEVDLDRIKEDSIKLIQDFAGKEGDMRTDIQPVAFGLQSLNITFTSDEKKGSTDEVEKQIADLDGVNSVEVTDVRRAIG
ncbi:elongation factor 1-beta [Candidatus Woesearchaeota archaeon]|nr:elongation factor 1-beta [Candidatus Woesearchaeota archaeon]